MIARRRCTMVATCPLCCCFVWCITFGCTSDHHLQIIGCSSGEHLSPTCCMSLLCSTPHCYAPSTPPHQVCLKTEAAAKAAELAKMRAFKAELDAQIDDNQARRNGKAEGQCSGQCGWRGCAACCQRRAEGSLPPEVTALSATVLHATLAAISHASLCLQQFPSTTLLFPARRGAPYRP